MSEVEWKPVLDRIIVKKINEEEEVTTSGLLIVNNEKNDKTKKAEVVAVGPGKVIDGKRVPLELQVGDTVIYNGMYGTDIGSFNTSHSNEYMILHEDDVIAIVQ